jgi:hypothetical protein
MRTPAGAGSAEAAGQRGADVGVDLLGLAGGGRAAGADGPDRLVGDDQPLARRRRRSRSLSAPASWLVDHRERVAGVALGVGLADADDDAEPGGQHRARPSCARRVEVSPKSCRRSLWPTITHCAPTSASSARRHLAGERAALFPVAVLRPPAAAALPSSRRATGHSAANGRRHPVPATVRTARQLVLEVGHQGQALGDRLVQLPVADHQRRAHRRATVAQERGRRAALRLPVLSATASATTAC